MKENTISYDIRGKCFKIYNELGPGLLESVYEAALEYELGLAGYTVSRQMSIPMHYKSIKVNTGFRVDLLVENLVVIEIKSVEMLLDVHYKQLLTYLRLMDKKLGLLINFNTVNLGRSIIRVVNNL